MNGAEAVEMVKSEEYDLVIMDIDMPVMGGYMAIQAIREWETMNERPRLPIILLSAEDAIRQRKIGASVGCSGYLTKPVAKGQLLDALRYYARVPKAAA